MPARALSSREAVYQAIVRLKGKALADRLVPLLSPQKPQAESRTENRGESASPSPYEASQKLITSTLHAAEDTHPPTSAPRSSWHPTRRR